MAPPLKKKIMNDGDNKMNKKQRQYYVMCDEGALTYPVSVRAPKPYSKYMTGEKELSNLDQDNYILYDCHEAIGAVYRAVKSSEKPAKIMELLENLAESLKSLLPSVWEMLVDMQGEYLQGESEYIIRTFSKIEDEVLGEGDTDTINDLLVKLHADVDMYLDGIVLAKLDEYNCGTGEYVTIKSKKK